MAPRVSQRSWLHVSCLRYVGIAFNGIGTPSRQLKFERNRKNFNLECTWNPRPEKVRPDQYPLPLRGFMCDSPHSVARLTYCRDSDKASERRTSSLAASRRCVRVRVYMDAKRGRLAPSSQRTNRELFVNKRTMQARGAHQQSMIAVSCADCFAWNLKGGSG